MARGFPGPSTPASGSSSEHDRLTTAPVRRHARGCSLRSQLVAELVNPAQTGMLGLLLFASRAEWRGWLGGAPTLADVGPDRAAVSTRHRLLDGVSGSGRCQHQLKRFALAMEEDELIAAEGNLGIGLPVLIAEFDLLDALVERFHDRANFPGAQLFRRDVFQQGYGVQQLDWSPFHSPCFGFKTQHVVRWGNPHPVSPSSHCGCEASCSQAQLLQRLVEFAVGGFLLFFLDLAQFDHGFVQRQDVGLRWLSTRMMPGEVVLWERSSGSGTTASTRSAWRRWPSGPCPGRRTGPT